MWIQQEGTGPGSFCPATASPCSLCPTKHRNGEGTEAGTLSSLLASSTEPGGRGIHALPPAAPRHEDEPLKAHSLAFPVFILTCSSQAGQCFHSGRTGVRGRGREAE